MNRPNLPTRLLLALTLCVALVAGGRTARAAGAAESWQPLPYRLGQGLYFPQQGLRLGGYASVHLYDLHGARPTLNVHDLSLFITKQVGARWQLFSEMEVDDALTATGDSVNSNQAEFDVERLYADYHARQGLTLRFGKFLTPVGQWNLIHADPLVWTVSRPLTTTAAFARHATGAMLYGSLPAGGGDLDYWLYLDDSERLVPSHRRELAYSLDGADASVHNSFNHAVGARVLYHLFNDRAGIGASWLDYELKTPQRRYRLYGLDFNWSIHRAELTGEMLRRIRLDTHRIDERGGFVQAVLPIVPRLYLVGRYEAYKTALLTQTTTINTVALNYRLRPAVTFKLEFRSGRHNALVAPDGWLGSFAVLF